MDTGNNFHVYEVEPPQGELTLDHIKAWAKAGVLVGPGLETPLVYVFRLGRLDLVQWFFRQENEDKAEQVVVMVAAILGHVQIAEWLCSPEIGLSPTDVGPHGRTPLHEAAANGHLSFVVWQVGSCGADVDATDANGCTALYGAARHGRLDIVKWLVVEGKADVRKRDTINRSPVLIAVGRSHLDVVQWLLGPEGGVDIHECDSHNPEYGLWSYFFAAEAVVNSRSELLLSCLKQMLLLSAPNVRDFLKNQHSQIVDLVHRSAEARPVLAEWKTARVAVLSSCLAPLLPQSLSLLVSGYAEPDLDETFGGAAEYGKSRGSVASRTRGSVKRQGL